MRVPRMDVMVRRALACRKGASMVEYALLAGLIAVVSLSTLGSLGNGVKNEFTTIANKL